MEAIVNDQSDTPPLSKARTWRPTKQINTFNTPLEIHDGHKNTCESTKTMAGDRVPRCWPYVHLNATGIH